MVEITIGIEGMGALKQLLGRVRRIVTDLRPAWDDAHTYLLRHMERVFATDGGAGGAFWADYSAEPKYRGYKRGVTGSLDILRWSAEEGFEELYPSLTQRDHPLHVFEVTPLSLTFGTSAASAADVDRGGIGPFGEPYPAREVVPLDARQRRELRNILDRTISRQLRLAGAT